MVVVSVLIKLLQGICMKIASETDILVVWEVIDSREQIDLAC